MKDVFDMGRRDLRSFLLMMALACLLPWGGRGDEPEAPTASYSGRLRTQYDYRAQGDQVDSDVYAYWYGSGRDLGNGRFDFYTSGRLHSDLDRPTSTSYADDMYISSDTLNGVTENRVTQLYIEGHSGDWRMRLGRQYVDIADYLQLDGLQWLLHEEGPLGGRIYVGSPFSHYTSVSADYAAGLSIIGRPWVGNSIRLTVSDYHDSSESGDDHNYYLDVRQEVTETTRTRGQLSILNEQFRMARLDLYLIPSDGSTELYMGGTRWGRFDAETRAYSPLYSVLGEQQPYTYAYARLTQTILPYLLIMPGVKAQFVDGGGEEANNRSYTDYDVTLSFEPTRAFNASLSVEYWDVKGGDSFVGFSGDVRYRHRRVWEVSLGAGYVDYSYNRYSDISYSVNGGQTIFSEDGTITQETPYVYTYTVKFKWNITRQFSLRMQGDIEDDSTETDTSYRGRASVEARL